MVFYKYEIVDHDFFKAITLYCSAAQEGIKSRNWGDITINLDKDIDWITDMLNRNEPAISTLCIIGKLGKADLKELMGVITYTDGDNSQSNAVQTLYIVNDQGYLEFIKDLTNLHELHIPYSLLEHILPNIQISKTWTNIIITDGDSLELSADKIKKMSSLLVNDEVVHVKCIDGTGLIQELAVIRKGDSGGSGGSGGAGGAVDWGVIILICFIATSLIVADILMKDSQQQEGEDMALSGNDAELDAVVSEGN